MLRVFLYFEDASVCESVCVKISQCMYDVMIAILGRIVYFIAKKNFSQFSILTARPL